ncbi:hypothetical protein E2562_007537 [Oryza meyeriana var. granulata]|uniref:Uncharacterized protein n=1 Tax=Oryza meyeriana var. granulata TaxID=110450 RepID=A0A6G1DW79_9ORYZ|nr:hypothetical protein E2562_007537 [Oryza meyeriana var. granulata]
MWDLDGKDRCLIRLPYPLSPRDPSAWSHGLSEKSGSAAWPSPRATGPAEGRSGERRCVVPWRRRASEAR